MRIKQHQTILYNLHFRNIFSDSISDSINEQKHYKQNDQNRGKIHWNWSQNHHQTKQFPEPISCSSSPEKKRVTQMKIEIKIEWRMYLFKGFNFDNGLGIKSHKAVLGCLHHLLWRFRPWWLEERKRHDRSPFSILNFDQTNPYITVSSCCAWLRFFIFVFS